jgi:hypothetical protein
LYTEVSLYPILLSFAADHPSNLPSTIHLKPPNLIFVKLAIKVDRKLIPALRITPDINRNRHTRALEQSEPLIINNNLLLIPSQNVRPFLTRMEISYSHSNFSGPGIRHNARQTSRVVRSSATDEANAVRIVEVGVLFSIGVEFPGEDHIGEFSAGDGIFGIVAFDAEEVTKEDGGVAAVLEEDDAVGERLEPAFDVDGHGLAGLEVVGVYDGLGEGERLDLEIGEMGHFAFRTYDGVLGLNSDEGVVEHASEVGIFGGADAGEVVNQRSIEEAELVIHVLEILLERLKFRVPVFSDKEKIVPCFLADVLNLERLSICCHHFCKSCQAYPLVQESFREMSDSVKTESGKT